MTGSCKGYCDRLPSFNRYVDGFKYCCTCEKFIQIGDPEPGKILQCPCCHRQVRLHGRRWGGKGKRVRVYH